MKPEQMDSLFRLMGGGPRISEGMRAALTDFFCTEGVRPMQKDLAARHSLHPGQLCERIKRARTVINQAYTLITGEQPQ